MFLTVLYTGNMISFLQYIQKYKYVQWNLFDNEVLGTMKITLLYQVSHLYQGTKNKEI